MNMQGLPPGFPPTFENGQPVDTEPQPNTYGLPYDQRHKFIELRERKPGVGVRRIVETRPLTKFMEQGQPEVYWDHHSNTFHLMNGQPVKLESLPDTYKKQIFERQEKEQARKKAWMEYFEQHGYPELAPIVANPGAYSAPVHPLDTPATAHHGIEQPYTGPARHPGERPMISAEEMAAPKQGPPIDMPPLGGSLTEHMASPSPIASELVSLPSVATPWADTASPTDMPAPAPETPPAPELHSPSEVSLDCPLCAAHGEKVSFTNEADFLFHQNNHMKQPAKV